MRNRMGEEEKAPSYGVIDRYLGEKGREYFTRQAADGLTKALYNKHLWQQQIFAEDDVLDFGCGGGFLLKVFQVRRRVGVEINPYARENAQQIGIETYATVEDVPGKFDKVISSHALEHVPHPRKAVLELKEKLKNEESRMLLLLPLDDWRSRANRRYQFDNEDMHLYTWTPQLLGNLLFTCGLRVREVRVVSHAWPPKSELFWRIAPSLFHLAAYAWSGINKQRQLFAVAGLK